MFYGRLAECWRINVHFDYRMDSNKCSAGLGFNNFYVQSPCNRLIEDYTEIFYMTEEGDIPSIQYKMILRRPKSIRKVDGLSLFSIDFMFQRLHHVSIAVEPRCSFLRT
jgi:hypothetical protein